MIVTLRVFGWAVLSLEIDDSEPAPVGITGGPTHDFERDIDYADNTDDRALGFRA